MAPKQPNPDHQDNPQDNHEADRDGPPGEAADNEQPEALQRRSPRPSTPPTKHVCTVAHPRGRTGSMGGEDAGRDTGASAADVDAKPRAVTPPLGSIERWKLAREGLIKLEAQLKEQLRCSRLQVEASRLPDGFPGHLLARQTHTMAGARARVGRGAAVREEGGSSTHMLDGMGECVWSPPKIANPLEPWNGRLGFACLNTYLRSADPAVFSSRTCRLSTIQNRSHPLTDPTQPYHATKNPPDLKKPADLALGLAYVQSLGLANARDIVPMLRWNAENGIRFMRLSSEMFPYASHETQGYDLGFAKDVLAEAGRVAAELDHRVTMHPGQYTQLGSPRPEVVRAAVRDLEYHDQLLELMALPAQLDRDAVIIIHMGGTFGDKKATLERFTEAYKALRPSVKRRLVLENDDACWSLLNILPTCEKLDIPLVLDWHHHTIVYDESMKGTHEELIPLLPRIAKTWEKKNITPKQHYSEPANKHLENGEPAPPRERRKHSARVVGLPPWRSDTRVDLCIEAKDKEQAVFELMRRFQGRGWAWDGVGDVIPHRRGDADDRSSGSGNSSEAADSGADEPEPGKVAPLDLGGAAKRVYWPEGKEEWLRPKKKARTTKIKLESDDKIKQKSDKTKQESDVEIKQESDEGRMED